MYYVVNHSISKIHRYPLIEKSSNQIGPSHGSEKTKQGFIKFVTGRDAADLTQNKIGLTVQQVDDRDIPLNIGDSDQIQIFFGVFDILNRKVRIYLTFVKSEETRPGPACQVQFQVFLTAGLFQETGVGQIELLETLSAFEEGNI